MSIFSKSESLAPWVLVAGGFHEFGGMDRANFALAQKLLDQGRRVFMVSHQIDSRLMDHPNVEATIVSRPLGSILLGERLLDRQGQRVARIVTAKWPQARVLVNGGNCLWPDINWVHAVNSAWKGLHTGAPLLFRTKNNLTLRKASRDERRTLRVAKLVIANSRQTETDLRSMVTDPNDIKTIYLGSDPDWSSPTADDRHRARQSFGIPAGARVVCFVGALGYDQRKGFDTLLKAWSEVRISQIILLAAGGGRGVSRWKKQIASLGLTDSVKMLGFTNRVRDVYDASDLLVSPVRYEPYGLNVQEAICRGVPAIVTRTAGVAEVYPPDLHDFLLPDPEDHQQLAMMIRHWHVAPDSARRRFEPLTLRLQARSWSQMAEEIIELAETHQTSKPETVYA